jgi:hypothetical protein
VLLTLLHEFKGKSTRTEGRSPRSSLDRPSLPKRGSVAEDHDRTGRELTRSRTRALEGHLWRSTPLSLDIAAIHKPGAEASNEPGAEDVEKHVGDAEERKKRKRGKRKRGRGGQGGRGDPDRTQAGPVAVRGPLSIGQGTFGKCSIPDFDNRPNISSLERRGKLTWSNGWPLSNEQEPLAGTDNLNKPPGVACLGGTPRGSPLNVLWTTEDANGRPPLLIANLRWTTLSCWASSSVPSISLRKGSYGSEKGIKDTVVLKQLFVSLHRWSDACACHSPPVLCKWIGPLVDITTRNTVIPQALRW